MCSETVAQDYHSRGNHVFNYNSNQLSRHSSAAMSAAHSPMNTMNGESNIYMEPTLATGANNYLSLHNDSQHNSLQSNHIHCQTGLPNHYLPNGNSNSVVNGSVPSSPLECPSVSLSPPTFPSTHLSSLPPYLTDSLSSNPHQHTYQTPDTLIPQQYFDDQYIHSTQEFLPLCDLLFNIISLAAYFCDVVFDSVTVYTLYLQRNQLWLSVSLGLILFSALVSQILSYRWYSRKNKSKQSYNGCENVCVLTIHAFLCGVLWRYFKLFIPVDLSSVKHEVRDLCVLRMVHAFCEAAPMLTLQIYLLWLKPSADQITDLNIISIFLSLFSLCWALASFSKNVRSHNIHKLVLTWLGVIFQFFWRLGTISSRVIALTVYATIYSYWVFAVIVLHWFSMLLWLLSPKNLFYGEKMSSMKRFCYTALIAWVYIFCYINMQEDNSRNRMFAFYLTMFLENTLLLSICLILSTGSTSPWFYNVSIVFVWGGFIIGMVFMILYYKFFHIRHLKHTLLATHYDQIDYPSNHCPEHGHHSYNQSGVGLNARRNGLTSDHKLQTPLMSSQSNGVIPGIPGVFNCRLNPALKRKKKKPSSFIPPPHPHPHISAPNALNTITSTISSPSSNNLGSLQSNKSITMTTKAPPVPVPSPTAFWKKSDIANGFLHSQTKSPTIASSPLTLPAKHPFSASIAPSPVANFTTELQQQMSVPILTPVNKQQILVPNIPNRITPVPTQRQSVAKVKNKRKTPEPKAQNSVSKVNIQQKLEEKKMQQFLHLKKIEEEIKQGIISKPCIIDAIESPKLMHKSVAPQAKKQPWITNNGTGATTFVPLANKGIHHYYYHPVYRRVKLRSQTPEVLLAPHYLDNSRVFYDYPSCVLPPIQSRRLKSPLEHSVEEEEEAEDMNDKNVTQNNIEVKRNAKNSSNIKINNNFNQFNNRFSSDIDSQISLPRSYTLPREFQYCRAGRAGNHINGVTDANGYLKSSRIRKPITTEAFHANVESNSSNDGDVDSDNPEDYDICAVPKIIRGPVNNMRTPVVSNRPFRDYRHKRHETPL